MHFPYSLANSPMFNTPSPFFVGNCDAQPLTPCVQWRPTYKSGLAASVSGKFQDVCNITRSGTRWCCQLTKLVYNWYCTNEFVLIIAIVPEDFPISLRLKKTYFSWGFLASQWLAITVLRSPISREVSTTFWWVRLVAAEPSYGEVTYLEILKIVSVQTHKLPCK